MRKTILIHFIILPAISFVSLSQTYMVADPPDSGDTLIEKTEIAKDTSNNNVKEKDNSQKSITEEVETNSIEDLFKFEKIVYSTIILLAGFFLLKIITKALQFFAGRSNRHKISLKGIILIVKLAGWSLIAYIIIIIVIQPPFGTVMALTVLFGIAVGLAAQDLIKNIFGGIIILFDRPFQTGDKIRIGENYGQVLTIGLQSTRIVTDDDSVVCIPNSEIMNQSVTNSNSGESNCQVVAEIYLPIDIDTVAVRDIALEVARVSKYVYLKKPISVLFYNEVKERRSFLKMRLKAYVLDIRHEFAFKSEMTELIVRELIGEGVLKKEDVS